MQLATGLSEQNPHLIAPGGAPPGFAAARDRVAALRPQVFRLLVDWSKVQPQAGVPPNWTLPQDGCLRGSGPCAPSAGIRDLLRALAARRAADGGWDVVVSFYGAPAWAVTPQPGCPQGGAIEPGAYAALLRSLRGLAAAEHVPIRWWSPWNEPNHPTFLAPQRAACDAASPGLSATAYAALVRTARATLPGAQLVLGDVAGYDGPRPSAMGAAEFAAALPDDVACASTIWAQHAYVGRGSTRLAADQSANGSPALLAAVEAALDAHGCPQRHHIWITETGVDPSVPDSCALMDRALRAWATDPRVDVAVQYTFRQDDAFPVGLADAGLTRLTPAYAAWRAWGLGDRTASGGSPPAPC